MMMFSLILTDLRAAIAARASRVRGLEGLLVLVWGRISRASQRLERLIARWRAGCLPGRRVRGARRAVVVAGEGVAVVPVRVPRGRGWLVAAVPEAGSFGLQLQHALTGPEWAEFLAAAPQAGRILRPLCRMLGVVVVPEALREVARVRVARVRVPRVRRERVKAWSPGKIPEAWWPMRGGHR